MSSRTMTTEQWKEVFSDIGLSPDDMNRWHAAFEALYPENHQQFLEWLNCSTEQIEYIRKGIK